MRAGLLAMTMAVAMTGAAMAQDDFGRPVITVTGEGRVDDAPDMATISLGVTSEGTTAADAMRTNSDEMTRVLGNLEAAGIAARDMQSSGLSLQPNWQHDSASGTSRIIGYIASNTLTVRVRALDTLGGVLDAAVKDGANTLNGVAFGLADPRPALDEARKRAVADAKARAELLAGAAGVKLGRILSISESGGALPPMPAYRMAADAFAAAVPVAAGEVAMQASVTIVWQLGK
jgi:uncharacterized protein YggE